MRFVIIASPRTGSSHLVNLLFGHPQILCHGNVFGHKMMPVFWPTKERPNPDQVQETKNKLRELRSANPQAFLEQIFVTGYGRPHVGFKIFREQNDEILNQMIDETSIRKVVLFRGNVLANYSSKLAAHRTGNWGVSKGSEPTGTPRVQFRKEAFIEFHDQYISYYRDVVDRLVDKRQKFHFVNYEEINDPILFSSLVSFIGADPRLVISETGFRKQQVKQNPSNILCRFSNVDEVEEFLTSNNRLHWKHEGETSLALWHEEVLPTAPAV